MNVVVFNKIKDLLDEKVNLYNNVFFIKNDPISIPHQFALKQDIEIAGFFAAIFAWGQRPTIINKTRELMSRMDDAPFDFIMNHTDADLVKLLGFKHRTFNDTDLLYCVDFMKRHYAKHISLEDAFVPEVIDYANIENSLMYFYSYFFNHQDAPARTRKHISTPSKRSACKRLNMYLRWMVRCDGVGVDFGLWTKLKPRDLICPLDLHVERTARALNLVTRAKSDWFMAMELTENLRLFDPIDPIKYDFALFGLSVEAGGKSLF